MSYTIMTTKQTGPWKVYGKILTELGRSVTQEKLYKNRIGENVRQPHQE